MYTNLFFFHHINEIGGIESWYYYISKKYGDKDITIMYISGDRRQIQRLSTRVRCIKWIPGQRVECVRLFVNFNFQIIDFCTYQDFIFFEHGDYKSMIELGQVQRSEVMKIANNRKITRFVGVSQSTCTTWEQVTGRHMELCYNPIEIDEPIKMIRICSAQRLTVEKGGNRIKELVKALDNYALRHNCMWEWTIYTNSNDIIGNPNVIFKKSTLLVSSILQYYDWFAILSDNEGYCYGGVESLLRGTPLITTPIPVFRELGINESNSLTLNFDCSNVDDIVEKVFTKKLNFAYVPPQDNIGSLLINSPSTYAHDLKSMVPVRALKAFERVIDSEIGSVRKEGEEWLVTKERAELLSSRVPPLVMKLK